MNSANGVLSCGCSNGADTASPKINLTPTYSANDTLKCYLEREIDKPTSRKQIQGNVNVSDIFHFRRTLN